MGIVYDGIIGLIVGDALGVPYEFRQRDTFNAVGMAGYGSHDQPPGTWSDDSSLTLATLESIGRLGRVDLDDIMTNFAGWMYDGNFTAGGKVFDVGITTSEAICNYAIFEKSISECGCTGERDNGNGSLMRILPMAFVAHSLNDIYNVSALTHAHDISKFACEFYIDVATSLLDGSGKGVAVKEACFAGLPGFASRLERLYELSRDDIKSSGYVIDTLEAALWCLLHTKSYQECVLTAVNLGEDTDTVAAVAGGLAGIYYGVGGNKGIPEEWIAKIKRLDYIKELCETFENKFTI